MKIGLILRLISTALIAPLVIGRRKGAGAIEPRDGLKGLEEELEMLLSARNIVARRLEDIDHHLSLISTTTTSTSTTTTTTSSSGPNNSTTTNTSISKGSTTDDTNNSPTINTSPITSLNSATIGSSCSEEEMQAELLKRDRLTLQFELSNLDTRLHELAKLRNEIKQQTDQTIGPTPTTTGSTTTTGSSGPNDPKTTTSTCTTTSSKGSTRDAATNSPTTNTSPITTRNSARCDSGRSPTLTNREIKRGLARVSHKSKQIDRLIKVVKFLEERLNALEESINSKVAQLELLYRQFSFPGDSSRDEILVEERAGEHCSADLTNPNERAENANDRAETLKEEIYSLRSDDYRLRSEIRQMKHRISEDYRENRSRHEKLAREYNLRFVRDNTITASTTTSSSRAGANRATTTTGSSGPNTSTSNSSTTNSSGSGSTRDAATNSPTTNTSPITTRNSARCDSGRCNSATIGSSSVGCRKKAILTELHQINAKYREIAELIWIKEGLKLELRKERIKLEGLEAMTLEKVEYLEKMRKLDPKSDWAAHEEMIRTLMAQTETLKEEQSLLAQELELLEQMIEADSAANEFREEKLLRENRILIGPTNDNDMSFRYRVLLGYDNTTTPNNTTPNNTTPSTITASNRAGVSSTTTGSSGPDDPTNYSLVGSTTTTTRRSGNTTRSGTTANSSPITTRNSASCSSSSAGAESGQKGAYLNHLYRVHSNMEEHQRLNSELNSVIEQVNRVTRMHGADPKERKRILEEQMKRVVEIQDEIKSLLRKSTTTGSSGPNVPNNYSLVGTTNTTSSTSKGSSLGTTNSSPITSRNSATTGSRSATIGSNEDGTYQPLEAVGSKAVGSKSVGSEGAKLDEEIKRVEVMIREKERELERNQELIRDRERELLKRNLKLEKDREWAKLTEEEVEVALRRARELESERTASMEARRVQNLREELRDIRTVREELQRVKRDKKAECYRLRWEIERDDITLEEKRELQRLEARTKNEKKIVKIQIISLTRQQGEVQEELERLEMSTSKNI